MHKTGSTSLQHFLKINEIFLYENNIFIPKSCRVWKDEIINHHNLAEGLIDSNLFSKDNNSFEDLLKEIKEIDKNILLSSEDFSKLVSFPEKLLYLESELNNLNFKIKYIVFTRYNSSYLRSLFFQLKTVKLINYFDIFNFVIQMNKNGFYKLSSGVKCYLDSDLFLNDWKKISKEKITSINYDNSTNNIFEEFITIILPGKSINEFQNNNIYLNKFKKNFFQPLRLLSYIFLNFCGYLIRRKKNK
tara:strand:+ start:169 stop:906 length:738 start_codon:yes stop_codon:yes gene_type:complete